MFGHCIERTYPELGKFLEDLHKLKEHSKEIHQACNQMNTWLRLKPNQFNEPSDFTSYAIEKQIDVKNLMAAYKYCILNYIITEIETRIQLYKKLSKDVQCTEYDNLINELWCLLTLNMKQHASILEPLRDEKRLTASAVSKIAFGAALLASPTLVTLIVGYSVYKLVQHTGHLNETSSESWLQLTNLHNQLVAIADAKKISLYMPHSMPALTVTQN